jgi:hypothetical protein
VMAEITTFVNGMLGDEVGWQDITWKKLKKENSNFDKESRFSWRRMVEMEQLLIGLIPLFKGQGLGSLWLAMLFGLYAGCRTSEIVFLAKNDCVKVGGNKMFATIGSKDVKTDFDYTWGVPCPV